MKWRNISKKCGFPAWVKGKEGVYISRFVGYCVYEGRYLGNCAFSRGKALYSNMNLDKNKDFVKKLLKING